MSTEKILITGDSIVVDGRVFTLLERVGNGASAFVFKAQSQDEKKDLVAVKAAYLESADAYRSEFEQETKNLQAIASKLAEHSESLRNLIPKYLGGELAGKYPYLVEEFVSGQDLDQAAHSLAGGVFSESSALYLAGLIGTLLCVLHEDLQICYGDMKFNNFQIINDSAAKPHPELKVLDWNLLSTVSNPNIQKDLLYASYYLFFMLTGHSLDIDRNNALITSNLQDYPEYTQLPIGIRDFLDKCFQPGLDQRFVSANAWLERINQLAGWWGQDDLNTLLDEAKDLKASAERAEASGKKENLGDLSEALIVADIASRKSSQEAQALAKEIGRALSGDGMIEKIEVFLGKEPPDHESATRLWDSFKSSPRYEITPKMLLWGYLIKAGRDLTDPNDYRLLHQALDDRMQGRYHVAVDALQRIKQKYQDNSDINTLEKEAQGQLLLWQASKKKITSRMDLMEQEKTYQNVLQIQHILSDDLQKSCFNQKDIESRILSTKEQLKIFDRTVGLFGIANLSETQSISNARQALAQTPLREPILEKILAIVNSEMIKGNYSLAEQMAGLERQDARFLSAWETAHGLRMLTQRCANLGIGTLETIFILIDYFQTAPKLSKDYSGLQTWLVENLLAYLRSQENLAPAFTLVSTVKQASSENDLYGLQSKIDQFIYTKIKQSEYQSPESIPTSRLLELLDLFSKLSIDFRQTEQDVATLENKLKNEKQRREATAQQNLLKISSLQKTLDDLRADLDAIVRLENNNSGKEILELKKKKVLEIIGVLLERKKIEQQFDLAPDLQWLSEKLDSGSKLELHNFVHKLLDNDQDAIKSSFNLSLADMLLEDASVLLDLLDPANNPENPFRKRYKYICEFLAWRKNFPDAENRFDEWLDIPAKYWSTPVENGKSLAQYCGDKVTGIRSIFSMDRLPDLAIWRRRSQIANGKASEKTNSLPWLRVEAAANEFMAAKSDETWKKLLENIDASTFPTQTMHSGSYPPNFGTERLQQPEKKQAKQVALGITGMLSIGVLLLVVGVFIGNLWPFKPTAVISIPISDLAATSTTRPIQTAEPTDNPTAVVEATHTNSQPADVPTAIPAQQISKYVFGIGADAYPNAPDALPAGIEPLYLIDDSDVKFYPDEKSWAKSPDTLQTSDGINKSMHWLAGHDKPDEYAEWQLDVPISKEGLYAFYINDPKNDSGLSQPVEYKVFINNSEEPEKPQFGTAKIKQLSQNKDGQTQAEWRGIGFYALKPGDTVRVRIAMPAAPPTDLLGIDALLIGYQPAFPSDFGPIKQLEAAGKPPILYWADDQQITVNTPNLVWKDITDSATWNGAHQTDTKSGASYQITWQTSERLNAGTYEVLVAIPAPLSVPVSFNITYEDGKALLPDKLEVDRTNPINPTSYQGQFISLGKVTIVDGEAHFLKIVMLASNTKADLVFAYDCIVIVPAK